MVGVLVDGFVFPSPEAPNEKALVAFAGRALGFRGISRQQQSSAPQICGMVVLRLIMLKFMHQS